MAPSPKTITLITEPTLIPVASMNLDEEGLDALARWVALARPECMPEDGDALGWALFPHDGTEALYANDNNSVSLSRDVSDNELLVELAGRNCYHSYGLKAGRKSNADYIRHTQQGAVPHRSILYHAKMTFFVAGVSRHLTHELMRHYVGADRDQEGSPSQESTRYTRCPGMFIVPPRVLAGPAARLEQFRCDMQAAYDRYLAFVHAEEADYREATGLEPRGLDRKRIYEAAAGHLPMHVATSVMWTANPVSLNKMFGERTDESAGLEFRRLALVWQELCRLRWPNLFPTDAG